jgi:3-oxoacyl-[acyl-carrier protein] reductase
VTSAGLAVVTGGSGGLGAAIARRLGLDGRGVLLVDRDDGVHRVADELAAEGIDARAVVTDLRQDAAPSDVARAVDASEVTLQVLINNAGITRDGRAEKLSEDDFTSVIEVNLVAAMRLALELQPRLGSEASVINLSSRAALGNFGQANYVAAKAGLIGMTRALALQWAPKVRVNALAPGLIDTPMTQAMPNAVREKLVSKIPMARIGTPSDVAGVVAFLAGPDARYVTGQLLLCCGGRSLAP